MQFEGIPPKRVKVESAVIQGTQKILGSEEGFNRKGKRGGGLWGTSKVRYGASVVPILRALAVKLLSIATWAGRSTLGGSKVQVCFSFSTQPNGLIGATTLIYYRIALS